MANVSLKNVTKLYPGRRGEDVPAIRNLDLEIHDREFVTLVGPPACGLSSIVRMIAGLADPSQGDILIGDRRVNDVPPKSRDVALVARNHALYPRMSLYDNLAFGLKSRKFSSTEIRKRVLDAAEILGLKELLEGKAESISGDQRQRVALARALALRPKVFLFDEPLAGLAAAAGESLRHEITQLHQRLQATMIYATHNPVEAMALGGRIIIVNRGAVEQDGPAQTLYDEPANVFVAEFFGSPPMNLILGSLKQDRDWLLFSEAEGGTIEARLPISAFPAGQDFMGKTVLLGIRPEDIKMADPAKTERYSGGFPALIDAVELAGSEANLSLQTGAHALRCRVARAEMPSEVGQRGRFQLNLSQLRLFDPNSTRRVAQTS